MPILGDIPKFMSSHLNLKKSFISCVHLLEKYYQNMQKYNLALLMVKGTMNDGKEYTF